MLGHRLISAFVIIATMLSALWLDVWLGTEAGWGRPGLVLCLLGICVATMAADELLRMWRPQPATPSRLTIVATFCMTIVGFMPVLWRDYPVDCCLGRFGWSLSGIIVAMVIVFFGEMVRFGRESVPVGSITNRLGRSALVFVYLSMLVAFWLPLRMMKEDNMVGLIAIVGLISTVKFSDTLAYFAGKGFGTVKIAPRLSPGKTLQGSLGALLGGCLAAFIVFKGVAPLLGVTIAKPLWWYLMYGILVTSAGMMGDLAESLLKRDADCKDSSGWLPGLGGVLDVIDSLIFAAPVAYLTWLIG